MFKKIIYIIISLIIISLVISQGKIVWAKDNCRHYEVQWKDIPTDPKEQNNFLQSLLNECTNCEKDNNNCPCECRYPQTMTCNIQSNYDKKEAEAGVQYSCLANNPCDPTGFQTTDYPCEEYKTSPPCYCSEGLTPSCDLVEPNNILKGWIWKCPNTEIPPSPNNAPGSYTFETGIPGIAAKGSTLSAKEGFSGLVNKIIIFVYSLAGILALAMLIYAGVQYTVSGGNAAIQKDAQDRIWQAIIGLVLLFSSYIILYTINPDLVRIKEPKVPIINNSGGNINGGGGNNNAPYTILTGFKWPLNTPPSRDSITSCYGYRNSEELAKSCGPSHYCLCHQGIDIAQDSNQPVYAVADGTVVDVGQGFTGLECGPVRITIKHQGQGGTYYSIYCHLGSSSVTSTNQVKAGEQIGTTDDLGHLHIAFGSASGYGDDTIRIDPACIFGTALTYGIEGVCLADKPITQYIYDDKGNKVQVCNFPPAGNCDLILGPKK